MTEPEEPNPPIGYIADLSEFQQDPQNANLHTLRGQGMVTNSQQKRGFARPGFADNENNVLGGNLSVMEVPASIGLGDGKIFVVESDGDIPIVHKRRDVDPESPEAILLAIEDNQSAVVSVNFDLARLIQRHDEGVDFTGIFTPDEIDQMKPGQGSDGSLLSLVDVTIAEPRHKVSPGEIWHAGEHVLICAEVLTGWPLWVEYLTGENTIFAPYPGPFVPLSIKADTFKMVMVQPNTYIAGHILDRYEDVAGEGLISLDKNSR